MFAKFGHTRNMDLGVTGLDMADTTRHNMGVNDMYDECSVFCMKYTRSIMRRIISMII